jgi:hypothetical protein
VSLLRDSYVDFTDQQVEELIAFFCLRLQRMSVPDSAATLEFRRRFDLMALQRNLKALGTFGFQTTSRGNTVYIQYIPRHPQLRAREPRKVRRPSDGSGRLAAHVEELSRRGAPPVRTRTLSC